MVRGKQKDYLADILSEETDVNQPTSSGSAEGDGQMINSAPSARRSSGGTTLLARESALARVAAGEVKQVTQLLLDPNTVKVWPGNARNYERLSEDNCRELIDSIIAEGGQKVPAIVRRIEGSGDHKYEVIAGTRRHWAISWLRQNNYPEMQLLAQVAQLDDEAAFRLADIENRARKDVSDIERARNYAAALNDHYANHLSGMAERLKLSKGWLSKMIKVASIPDHIIAAFASPSEIRLKPAYPLAQALADKARAPAIRNAAKRLASEQKERMKTGKSPIPTSEVLTLLLASGEASGMKEEIVMEGAHNRPAVTVKSSNRQGVTIRLHSGHGLDEEALLESISGALQALKKAGRGLQR